MKASNQWGGGGLGLNGQITPEDNPNHLVYKKVRRKTNKITLHIHHYMYTSHTYSSTCKTSKRNLIKTKQANGIRLRGAIFNSDSVRSLNLLFVRIKQLYTIACIHCIRSCRVFQAKLQNVYLYFLYIDSVVSHQHPCSDLYSSGIHVKSPRLVPPLGHNLPSVTMICNSSLKNSPPTLII